MKTRSILIFLFAFSLIFAGAVFAADPGDMSDQSAGTSGMSESAGVGGAQAEANIIKAEELKGKSIHDSAGKKIGKIDSIALNTKTGAAFALLSIDKNLHPVPINALSRGTDGNFVLGMSKEKVAQSPMVTDKKKLTDMASSTFDSKVYQFYGIAPPFGGGAMHPGGAMEQPGGAMQPGGATEQPGSPSSESPKY